VVWCGAWIEEANMQWGQSRVQRVDESNVVSYTAQEEKKGVVFRFYKSGATKAEASKDAGHD